MATSKRLQLASAAGAVLLLGAAWFVTERSDGDAAAPTTTTTSPRPTTTVAVTEPPAPTTSTTTEPERPPNTEWGALNLVDVTAEAGLDEPHADDPPLDADGQTGGVAVADYDDDGDQDVFLTRVGLPNRLMRNDGSGSFTDVAEAAGVEGADPEQGYAAVVWVDVDGDADLDLYLTGAGQNGSLLLVNDGSGRFTDETAEAGLGGLGAEGFTATASFGAAFADWDRDGDLDLATMHWYVAPFGIQIQSLSDEERRDPEALDLCRLADRRMANPPTDLAWSRSRMFENDGDGTFTDVTEASGVDVEVLQAFQPVFADVDDDGWEDLLITGDFCTSRLYRNDRGRGFVDVTAEAGVGTDQNGMGSVVADLDGDGNLDWFVSAIAANSASCTVAEVCSRAGNRVYLGDGTGRFTDGTDRLGLRDGSWGWGAVAADLNQDGRVDLALANGVRFETPDAGADATLRATDEADDDPTRIWVNTGAGPWTEAAEQIGARDRVNGKGIVAFDADGDGDLDLLMANTEVAPILYRNDTPPGDDKHWLQLRLRDPGSSNPWAIGARVTVDRGDGSAPVPLRVSAGGSFQSGDPTDLHVGLGASDQVARIEVRWPGSDEPQVLTDVAADQVLEISRPG